MALVFLLLWTTKWPQYLLILTAPFSMSAAEGFRKLVAEPYSAWRKKRREEKRGERIEKEAKQRYLHEKKAREKAERKNRAREARRAIPWLVPGIIGLVVITLFPLIFQFAMALTDFNGSSIFDGMKGGVLREAWLGLTGQVDPAQSNVFGQAFSADKRVHYVGGSLLQGVFANLTGGIFVFDLVWTILSVFLQLALGVSIALLLDKKHILFKGWWGAVFILPWAVPEFVGTLIWSQVFDPDFGWAATVASLARLGPYAASWQGKPLLALAYLLIAGVWYGFPLMYAAASAGLKSISADVQEAASLDGANSLSRFRHITWPLILPLLVPVIILRVIFAFNQFYLFYMMGMEYPTTTLSVISFMIFNYGQNYSLSAAINIFTVILLLVMILFFNRFSKASEGVTYA
jgi:ABC-type sugar transport system permease subunit